MSRPRTTAVREARPRGGARDITVPQRRAIRRNSTSPRARQAVTMPGRSLTFSIEYGDGFGLPLWDPEIREHYCPQLHESFSAELAGASAPGIIDGHSVLRTIRVFRCEHARGWFTLPLDLHTPDAQLSVGDDSFSFNIPVGELLFERTAELVGGTGSSLQLGQPVTFRWSPAGDLTSLPYASVSYLTTSDVPVFSIPDVQITRGLDTLSFTLPQGPLPPGSEQGILYLKLSDFRAISYPSSCGGHYRIQSISQIAYREVTIAP